MMEWTRLRVCDTRNGDVYTLYTPTRPVTELLPYMERAYPFLTILRIIRTGPDSAAGNKISTLQKRG